MRKCKIGEMVKKTKSGIGLFRAIFEPNPDAPVRIVQLI
jgi:hypothetical protein